MKISFICPRNTYGESATSGIYYPMGILLVGSKLKGHEVQILDGELYSDSELEEKIRDSDIVGLSANTDNYPCCLSLVAKAENARVVVGGPHASAVLKT